ncbi:MAG: hypothetical protein QF732_12945, partial [Nitrospinaceae bacterium]|nr:hypothetical protein [Nitrospinaceae bacterium]
AALELSKKSLLLAIQIPGRDNPSLHPLAGGDAAGLMAKLDAARHRVSARLSFPKPRRDLGQPIRRQIKAPLRWGLFLLMGINHATSGSASCTAHDRI